MDHFFLTQQWKAFLEALGIPTRNILVHIWTLGRVILYKLLEDMKELVSHTTYYIFLFSQ